MEQFRSKHKQTQSEWEAEMSKKVLEFVRSELYMDLRFLDIALGTLVYRADENIRSFATDGTYLYFSTEQVLRVFQSNPKYLDRAYLHSVLHCIFFHLWIGGKRDREKWNLACDIAVEYTIDQMDKPSTRRILSWQRQTVYEELKQLKSGVSAAVIYRYLSGRKPAELIALQKEFYTDDHRYWPKEEQKNAANEDARKQWDKIARQTRMEKESRGDETEDGEAVSEPKALAEVQETLGKVAENVMKTMISSDEVTSIDVREMRLMQAKLSINQTLAKKEQYSIPVLVGDKVTNVSLKIVRGVETKGIVDIMLESEMSGKIAATFQAKEEGISGLVVTDKQETRDLLADQMGFLASAIQESDGEQVDLRFAIEKNLDLNHFSGVASGKSGNVTFVNDSAASTKEAVDKEGQSTEGKKEDSVYKVQTARLYHIAEAFLKTIREFE